MDANAREKLRQAHLGKKMSSQAKERVRQANLGKKLSPETKEKLSRIMSQRWADLNERRKLLNRPTGMYGKQSAARKRANHKAMLKRWQDPEYRRRMSEVARKGRLQQKLPQKMTSIERALRNEFKKRRLKFEMHKTMFGRFQPDFVFEDAQLIVQADGDYWHSIPKARHQDAAFAKAAATEGWSVWRFGEKEIHMHSAACARAVARFVRDHQDQATS